MNEITTRALTKIRALPKTPDAIANFLFKGGFLGEPRTASRCPISRYLREEVDGQQTLVLTSRFMIMIQYRGAVVSNIEPYKGLYDFLVRFDDEKYPELITGNFLGEILNDDSRSAIPPEENKS